MQQPNELFNRHWRIYQKVLSSNAMFHQVFADRFREVMHTHKPGVPLDLLDLGCGDAGHIADVLSGLPIASYTGYDLSAPALELAQEQLKSIVPRYDLHCGAMEETIRHETRHFDVVYSGYAIHHLADEAKAEFVGQIFTVLKPGGLFFLVDVYRPDDQPVEAYTTGMTNWIQSTWTFLDAQERKMICDHVSGYDQPASYADLGSWAKTTGFQVDVVPGGDIRHHALLMTKPDYVKN
jgi:SAM-dependent methyltransferase